MPETTYQSSLSTSLVTGLAIAVLGTGAFAVVGRAQSTRPTTQPASRPTTQATKQVDEPVPVRVPPVPAFIKSAKPSGKTMFIHYKTNFDHDDNPGCVAFNVTLAALAAGDRVEFHYDAGGVLDLKLIRQYGQSHRKEKGCGIQSGQRSRHHHAQAGNRGRDGGHCARRISATAGLQKARIHRWF